MTIPMSRRDAERAGIAKRSKYRAQPTVVDGIRFASKREAARYQELKALETAGEIVSLKTQVVYRLRVYGTDVGSYVADFVYAFPDCRAFVVEDCKGYRTPVYKLKKKLVKAIYGIEIRET